MCNGRLDGLMCNVLRVGVADVQWKVGRIDVQCSEGGCYVADVQWKVGRIDVQCSEGGCG